MANWFYVKDGGTATGDGGKETDGNDRSGLWSSTTSEYYDSIYSCILEATTAPDDGDYIIVSDSHAQVITGATTILNGSGSFTGAGLIIVSVDDSNQENYSPGASEELTGNFAYTLSYNGLIAGVSLKTADNTLNLTPSGAEWVAQDLTLSASNGIGDVCVRFGAQGTFMHLINVELSLAGTSAEFIFLSNGSLLLWDGGSVSGSIPAYLCDPFGGAGGATAILNGVDLSAFNTTLMKPVASNTSDTCLMRLANCRLHADVTLTSTITGAQTRFEMFNTDDSTAKVYHRFYVKDGLGLAQNNDSTYVTATEAWYEGTDKSSIQVDTESGCSHARPFVFELPAQYINLGNTDTDTLTIEMVTEETLNAQDMVAFLVYPDGTTAVIPKWKSSGPIATGFLGTDPLDSTTAMGASTLTTSDWTEALTGETYYGLILDTSGVAGQATAVSVRIEVYKDLTSPVYIHPLITVSAT